MSRSFRTAGALLFLGVEGFGGDGRGDLGVDGRGGELGVNEFLLDGGDHEGVIGILGIRVKRILAGNFGGVIWRRARLG